MTALIIRPADHADVPCLLDLYVHLNPDDARCPTEKAVAVLDRLLRYEGSAILVGAIGDTLVTTCTLVVIPNLTRGGSPYALIENVVTHADHRGAGFGRAVLAAGVERAWEAECYKGYADDRFEEGVHARVLQGGRIRAIQDGLSGQAGSGPT